MSELISNTENEQSVNDEFEGIIAASYEGQPATNSKSLGGVAMKEIKPFGVDLMMTFTDAHDARAREQADMITVTTYHAVSGRIHDR